MKKLLVLLLFLPLLTNAKKFYFSSSGSDSYSVTQAQNPATPWFSLKKMEQMSRTAGVFQAGDTLAFKRGDVFANGYVNTFASMQWRNDGGTYWIAPSGTPDRPIVITNYGDTSLPLPNWLWPQAIYPVNSWCCTRPSRHVVCFTGVANIIIEGIQSNDFRMPESDKINPGYTGGWLIGEWSNSKLVNGVYVQGANNPNNRKYMVTNFKVRNCVFNNTQYGFSGIAAINSEFSYNTITNLKSTADTAGVNDVMAGAFEAVYGFNLNIHHNYIKGAWAKSGRISSTSGLGGVGFDIFNLKNSRIAYNTIIDCSGMFEIGNLDRLDSTAGAQYDTFAFNKIINTGGVGYLHGSVGSFIGNNHHLSIWNNVFISNNKDRQNGLGFGNDLYNDGQGFRPGTPNAWWFCRNPLSTFNPPNYPLRPTTNTTAGSNIVTVSNATGISVGSVAFANNDDLLGAAYQTVTVVSVNGNQLTLSVSCNRTTTTTNISYYLPLSDQTWSNPTNSAYANYGGTRAFIQYASDNTTYGSYIDTMIDSRNNILYWTTGIQALYDRNRFKRNSNIYCPLGSARYTTSVGSPLKTNERIITTAIFTDTTAIYPEDWNLRPVDTNYAYNAGVAVPNFTEDFAGNLITSSFIGLFGRGSTVQPCNFTYGQWSECVNGQQTRPYTFGPAGCTGQPPIDSIQRTCSIPCTFSYSDWSTCSNGTQTRTYTASPNGCDDTPPADSIQRTCTVPCSFQYASWSTCSNGVQVRDYTSYPSGCSETPPMDSIRRVCVNPPIVTILYYDDNRKSVFINSKQSGTMVIKNLLGSTVRTRYFQANGDWVNVRNLSSSTYVAMAYDKSIIFIKR
jgi:hypothetical protein